MKLTQFDRALIHGLAVLSRPPLTPEAREYAMLADIVAKCAKQATRDGAMLPLIQAAGQVGRTPAIHRGAQCPFDDQVGRFRRSPKAQIVQC